MFSVPLINFSFHAVATDLLRDYKLLKKSGAESFLSAPGRILYGLLHLVALQFCYYFGQNGPLTNV